MRNIRSLFRGLYDMYLRQDRAFRRDENRLLSKYYNSQESVITSSKDRNANRRVIFMIDGRAVHGGLADRLRGICSVYYYCKQHNIKFYLNAVYPFELREYLVPNKYNWYISPEDILYTRHASVPVLLNTHQLDVRLHEYYIKRKLSLNKDLHVYGNTSFRDEYFSVAFNDLFKPSPKLSQHLQELRHSLSLQTDYVAVVTRFQQLLGDFKETGYKTLSEEDRVSLIDKCIQKIQELHETQFQGRKILCTSDSITFLSEVDKLPYVSVIPGKVVHMDHTSDASYEVYEKSFLDFMMIASSKQICLLKTGDMYHSGFPRRAAMVNKIHYKEIIF